MSELIEAFRGIRSTSKEKIADILSDNYVKSLDELHPQVPTAHKLDFLSKALITGANPMMGEIFLVPRKGKDARGNWITNGITQFSYHFFLSRAMSTGEVDSFKVDCYLKEVYSPFRNKVEKQMVAVAEVLKKGSKNPIIYKARWNEFAMERSPQWQSKPCLMLEKCALANAFRWAFPIQMHGLYIQEEMGEVKKAEPVKPAVKKEKGLPNVDSFVSKFVNKEEKQK